MIVKSECETKNKILSEKFSPFSLNVKFEVSSNLYIAPIRRKCSLDNSTLSTPTTVCATNNDNNHNQKSANESIEFSTKVARVAVQFNRNGITIKIKELEMAASKIIGYRNHLSRSAAKYKFRQMILQKLTTAWNRTPSMALKTSAISLAYSALWINNQYLTKVEPILNHSMPTMATTSLTGAASASAPATTTTTARTISRIQHKVKQSRRQSLTIRELKFEMKRNDDITNADADVDADDKVVVTLERKRCTAPRRRQSSLQTTCSSINHQSSRINADTTTSNYDQKLAWTNVRDECNNLLFNNNNNNGNNLCSIRDSLQTASNLHGKIGDISTEFAPILSDLSIILHVL